jgi:hypothetical protein
MCKGNCGRGRRRRGGVNSISLSFKFIISHSQIQQSDSLSPILLNLALQKVIQSIKMVPSGIMTGKEQLNILAYADNIVLMGKNETEI